MKRDFDQIAKIEKAISKKYGSEAVQNPKKYWTDDKEKEYISQMKEFYKKLDFRESDEEKQQWGEFKVSKRIINRKVERVCPVCKKYSFDYKDDLYMNRYECCYNCYIQYVEDREARWSEGWRPEID